MQDIRRLQTTAWLAWLFAAGGSFAQVPMAELDALTPPGAQAGQTIKLQPHGSSLDELAGVLVSDAAVKGSLENGQIHLEIPEGLSPRLIDVSVHGRFGVSNPRAFAVGNLPEIQETGDHQKRDSAQVVELDQTLNGSATASLVDWFQFTPTTTEPIVIEVLAERIDSRMDPTLVIVDAKGYELERYHDVHGRDVRITFTPSQPNQPYYLGLNDFLYEGGASHYYRLSLTKSPIDRQAPVRIPANLSVLALSEQTQAYEAGQTLTSIPVSISGETPPRARPYVDLVVEEAGAIAIELFSDRLGQPTDYWLRVSTVSDDGKLKKVVEDDDTDDSVKDKRFLIGSRDPIVMLKAKAKQRYRIEWRDQFQSMARYRLELRRPQPSVHLIAAAEKPHEVGNQLSRWSPVLRRGGTVHWEVLALRRDGFDGRITVRAKDLPEGVTASPLTIAKGQHRGVFLLTASADAPAFAGVLSLVGEMELAGEKVSQPVQGATLLWSIGDANSERWEGRLTPTPAFALLAQETAPLSLVAPQTHYETCLGGKLELPFAITRLIGQAGNFKTKLSGLPGLAKALEANFNPDAKEVKLTLNVVNNDNNKFVPGDYVIHARAWEGKIKYRTNPEAADRAAADLNEKEAALEVAVALKTSLESKDVTEARTAEVQKQLDEATAAKEAAAKIAEEAKKRAAPQDLTHAVVSQPVFLRIDDGPLKISELKEVSAEPGKDISVIVSFERLYGFSESVEFQLVPGKDSKLFEPSKVAVAKEVNEASFKVTLSSEAKAGRFQATVEAKIKFNGQDLTINRPVAIVIP